MTKIKRDFTEGPLFFRITLFALPIMATGILQVLYNMADSMIVGKFSSDPNALAAVGSTGPVNNLLINLFMGIAIGAGIVVAQNFGAKRYSDVSDAAHTAITFSLFIGIVLGTIGFIISPYILSFIGIRPEFIDQSTLYMRIIMCGLPASSVYNFGASILRSVGDSKTPLIILSLSGLLNVALNLVFVLGFNMSVDGVALATIVSQYLSAVIVVVLLVKRRGEPYSIKFKQLKIHTRLLKRMLKIGVPSALSSCMYSIANIAIMSAINTFPPASVSAYSISSNIEGITYTSMNCFQQASMTFTGQNYGAKKNDRIKKVFIFSIIQVAFIGILMGQTEILFGEQLANLYINADDPNKALVIAETQDLLKVMLSCYFLCGIMEVCSGALRGLGYATITLVNSLVFACAVRLIWIYLIFFKVDSLDTMSELVLAFPISWIITNTAHVLCILYIWRKEGIWKKREKAPIAKSIGE